MDSARKVDVGDRQVEFRYTTIDEDDVFFQSSLLGDNVGRQWEIGMEVAVVIS